MFKCNSEEVAKAFAANNFLLYGYCVFGSGWYVGGDAELRAIGVHVRPGETETTNLVNEDQMALSEKTNKSILSKNIITASTTDEQLLVHPSTRAKDIANLEKVQKARALKPPSKLRRFK